MIAACDQDRIAQVVSNLIMNAIYHTEGSMIAVSLRAEGEAALISVRDDGPGIPAD